MPLGGFGGNQQFGPIIKAKTAAYTVLASEDGVVFTNRGATAAVAFILPLNSTIPIGFECTFYGISATGFSVASNPADTLVVLNDATADSLTMTTTSLIIGAALRVMWDGVGWMTFRWGGNTFTVAT
jgi:hypothetical protein